jgi:CHASE2 domain-containing sensor protein
MLRWPWRVAPRTSLRELATQEDVRRAAITFLTGLFILLLMQVPVVERSFLGALDREMLDTAFKMRADVIRPDADPAVLLDIDDRSLSGEPSEANLGRGPPLATTPRDLVADLLEFVRTTPAESRPKAVLVDIDLATPTPGEEAAVERLMAILGAWSADPSTPPLIIAREVFPPESVAVPGPLGVLPMSPYDTIVERAPNIFWGSVKTLADQDGVIREFLPFECARTTRGVQVLYSSVLLAYGFLERGPPPPGSPVERWIERAEPHCREKPGEFIAHGERINYHLSMGRDYDGLVWPELPPTWDGFETCGRSDSASFRRLSAADVIAAGSDASRAVLCGRLVVIGGTNTPRPISASPRWSSCRGR